VLAEAGINHNGEMENAKRLIDLAKLCGVCHCQMMEQRAMAFLRWGPPPLF
jgi:sialic acid synthase SpsE